jgi:hypothetical protein
MDNQPYSQDNQNYQNPYQPLPPSDGRPPEAPFQHPQQNEHGHHQNHHGHHGHGHDQNHHQPHDQHHQFQDHHQPPAIPAFLPPQLANQLPVSQPELSPAAVPIAPAVAAVGVNPQPVVRVLSPRGVEYVFLTIALLSGAFALAGILLSMVNGKFNFEVLSFPTAVLTVSFPTFVWLFLRLKQAELLNPALRLDASKRRSTQFIQIFTFLVCFFTLIGFVTTLFAKLSGHFNDSFPKVILDVLVIEAVAGGILYYYWRDEHTL